MYETNVVHYFITNTLIARLKKNLYKNDRTIVAIHLAASIF